MTDNSNPLNRYYRQPAVYVRLPSKGAYYNDSVFEKTVTGEVPILPMTAKDEMAFKTPDALINGQATVDVIRSCVPNIKDPWKLVNYDLDTVLLGIRIATYGESMDINATVPVINEQITQAVSLPTLLDTIANIQLKDSFITKDNFTIKVNPLTYKEITDVQVKTYNEQKTVVTVRNSQLTEEEKTVRYNETYKNLNDLNYLVLSNSITSIKTPDGTEVTDQTQIKEFLNNTGSTLVNEIQEGVLSLRSQAQIKPLRMQSTEEQIKKGAPANYEIPLTFDNANFFV
jgi:hypothetical protein